MLMVFGKIHRNDQRRQLAWTWVGILNDSMNKNAIDNG